MYRSISLILWAVSVWAAPQDGINSDITYVKIQPVTDTGLKQKAAFRESRIENVPLTIPGSDKDRSSEEVAIITEDSIGVVKEDKIDKEESESVQDNPRKVRSEDSTASYDDTDPTESDTEVDEQTEVYEPKTRAPSPRFLSKLSYFQKDNDLGSSIATNLVERTGKRKFKSKCRCEKIWNCPKLQITVPRCPNEYFLCCF